MQFPPSPTGGADLLTGALPLSYLATDLLGRTTTLCQIPGYTATARLTRADSAVTLQSMAGRPCDFSESTFAFNFTENICRRARSSIQFAPIFPTLRQEGRLDMGYDVLIRLGAVPVLFQFKIPDFISRRSGDHRAQFTGPYYRFKIMPSRVSTQHQALLNHEKAGTPVRYASPRFHLMMDLHSFAVGGHVPAHSKMIPPSVIGPLPDPAETVASISRSMPCLDVRPGEISRFELGNVYGPQFSLTLDIEWRGLEMKLNLADFVPKALDDFRRSIEAATESDERRRIAKAPEQLGIKPLI